MHRITKLLLVGILACVVLLMSACGNDTGNTSGTNAPDTTGKQTGEVVLSENMIYSAGLNGEIPPVYDELTNFLAEHFERSEIFSASIDSVFGFDENGDYTTRDSEFVAYYVICDDIGAYFYYSADSGNIYTTYYKDRILSNIANKIADMLHCGATAYREVYFTSESTSNALPFDIKTEDDFLNYYHPGSQELSFYSAGKCSDINVSKIPNADIEKIMHDYRLTQFNINSLDNSVQNESDFDEIDIVGNLYATRNDDSTNDTLNIRIERSVYGFVTDKDNTVMVRCNKEFMDILGVTLEDVETPLDANAEYEPFKAIAVQVKKVRDISDDGMDIRTQPNDFGGTTQFVCFSPYYLSFYCSNSFDGYYTNLYGDWQQYSNPDNVYDGSTTITLPLNKDDLTNNAEFTYYGLIFYTKK